MGDGATPITFERPPNLKHLRIRVFASSGVSRMQEGLADFWTSGMLSHLAVHVFLDIRRSETMIVEQTKAALNLLTDVGNLVEEVQVTLWVITGQGFQGWLQPQEARELFAPDAAQLKRRERTSWTWDTIPIQSVLRKTCGQPSSGGAVRGWEW